MKIDNSRIFSIRVGDRAPYIAYEFGFSLALATSVSFSARDVQTNAVFIDRQPAIIANGTYTIGDEVRVLVPADGVAFYPWAAGDTAVQRKSILCLFHIIWPGNLPETLPSDGYERATIGENF